ncbi:MAG: (2Fe-2S)-binding protein [Rhodothermales bacterium]
MNVDRCLCHEVTFRALKDLAAETGASTVTELQARCRFGKQCGLCRPYVRAMLRSGEVAFDRLLSEPEASGRDRPDRTASSLSE